MQQRLKYTPQQLRTEIERYFSSITTIHQMDTLNQLGEPIRKEVFITAPTLEELVLRLGISMREWESYCAGCPQCPGMRQAGRRRYRAAAEYAYSRLCVWLEQELLTRNRGSLSALGERLAQYCAKREQCYEQKPSGTVQTLGEKEMLLRQLTAVFAENPKASVQEEEMSESPYNVQEFRGTAAELCGAAGEYGGNEEEQEEEER